MIWNYIKGSNFFPKYAPQIKNWKKKMSGFNGKGNPIDFSHSDNEQIKKGLKKLIIEVLQTKCQRP